MNTHLEWTRPLPGSITVVHEGDRRVLCLRGEVDTAVAERFKEAQGRRPILLDAIDAATVSFHQFHRARHPGPVRRGVSGRRPAPRAACLVTCRGPPSEVHRTARNLPPPAHHSGRRRDAGLTATCPEGSGARDVRSGAWPNRGSTTSNSRRGGRG